MPKLSKNKDVNNFIERIIAVKNRSHKPKTTNTKLQSFFSMNLAAFQASGGADTCLSSEARRAKGGHLL
jgi:hypothetical protein